MVILLLPAAARSLLLREQALHDSVGSCVSFTFPFFVRNAFQRAFIGAMSFLNCICLVVIICHSHGVLFRPFDPFTQLDIDLNGRGR